MSPKSTRKPERPIHAAAVEVGTPQREPAERDVKPLTVNVPCDTLHKAKTRASLEGTTMSAVVSDALATYANGLGQVLGQLGYTEKK